MKKVTRVPKKTFTAHTVWGPSLNGGTYRFEDDGVEPISETAIGELMNHLPAATKTNARRKEATAIYDAALQTMCKQCTFGGGKKQEEISLSQLVRNIILLREIATTCKVHDPGPDIFFDWIDVTEMNWGDHFAHLAEAVRSIRSLPPEILSDTDLHHDLVVALFAKIADIAISSNNSKVADIGDILTHYFKSDELLISVVIENGLPFEVHGYWLDLLEDAEKGN